MRLRNCLLNVFVSMAGAAGLSAAPAPDLFRPAVRLDDFDCEASGIVRPKGFAALSPEKAEALLKREGIAWWAALGDMQDLSTNTLTFHYRLAFKQPVAIGSMLVWPDGRSRGAMAFRYLKPEAAFPGDPNRAADWETLPTVAAGGHHECAFPPGLRVRAILGTHTAAEYSMSAIHRWNLYAARLQNVTPHAVAQAEEAPRGTDPAALTCGGEWQNAGKDDEGRVARTPVSSVAPSWFTLVWDGKQRLTGARIQGNADEFKLYAFTGGDGDNPALAPARDWQRIVHTPTAREEFDHRLRHLVSFAPVETRALKLLVNETSPRSQQVLTLGEFSALADLQDRPVPPPAAKRGSAAPCAVPYSLPIDGEAALVIDDAAGVRVRNMFAQVARAAGDHAEPWDLRDERGNPVPPGTYRWRAITAPPLELHYALTPYPNVEQHSPESTPWNRGPKDGWLSNHGNPCAVCVVGDKVYIGAGGTEGGHAFIETDFGGAKLWGSGEGIGHLFSDGTTLFGEAGGTIRRFDAAARQWKDLVATRETTERKGTLVGRAAREGRVYLAFNSPLPYLDDVTDSSMVDGENCLPKRKPVIKGAGDYGMDLSPLRDFLSLFRLGGHISGEPRTQIYIETTQGSGRQQHTVLPFRKPMPLGSLVFPMPEGLSNLTFRVSTLKPDAPYPPRVREEADWAPIETGLLRAWNCVPVAPGTMTRALRLTFARPGDDTTEMLEGDEAAPTAAPGLDGLEAGPAVALTGAKPAWKGRIEGMRLLRMRFTSLLPTARVRVNSGRYDEATGEWDAQRSEPLSANSPGIFAMEWDRPQKLRGLAIKEIDGAETRVDVYVGPAAGPIDIGASAGWTNAATYLQKRRNYYQPDSKNNKIARYLDGMVDLGREWETRAVRLRVIRQWGDRSGYPEGVRTDRGGETVDPKRCRIYGVAPLAYVGGEAPVDPLVTQRLCVHDGRTGRLESERPSRLTGPMAFHPSGALHGIRDAAVVRADAATGETTPFVTDLVQPRLLDFDGKGRLYVFDQANDRRVVRVYDEGGTFVRNIGTPGPRKAGPYDPGSFHEICALSVDRAGEFIWLVYPHEDPRRVIKFRTDGTHVQDYLGNTHYGGGGILDPFDKSRLWYKDVLFDLDWQKGASRVKALVSLDYWEASPWGPSFRPDWHPIPVDGRLYLAAPGGRMASVYLFDAKALTVRMAAAFGAAAAFPHLKNDAVIEHLKGRPLGDFNFLWADRNGNGALDLPEVEFTPRDKEEGGLGPFDRSLAVLGTRKRYEVARFLPDGTPVYASKPMPFGATHRLNDGNYWHFADGANEVLSPEGKRLWSYRAKQGMDGLNVYPWSPGVADLQFGLSGHAVAHAGDLGEFVVVHANNGQMNIWTADGFLAGHITYHTGDPRARGWPSEHARGTRLDGLTLGQEHFHHYFCKAEQDNTYYIVAGHSWISLIEIRGLEKFRRASGEFTVTPAMLEQTRAWENERAQRAAFARPRVIESAPAKSAALDGAAVAEIPNLATFQMAHDGANLYLKWTVKGNQAGVFANSGEDFRRCFKTGAAVDLQLGTDPRADRGRAQAAAGDLRVVIAPAAKPFAVLYRPVAPRATKGEAWSTSTPAGGTASFEQVAVLTNASIKVELAGEHNPNSVTAVLPLDALGLKIETDVLYRMDWGVLTSRDGFITSGRRYWANASATGVSDEPTEARLTPNLWGYLKFVTLRDATALPDAGRQGAEQDIEDVLDGIMKK